MAARKDTENFIRKRLADLIYVLKIQDHSSETVDPKQEALRL